MGVSTWKMGVMSQFILGIGHARFKTISIMVFLYPKIICNRVTHCISRGAYHGYGIGKNGIETAGNTQTVIEIIRETLQKEDFGIISYVTVSEKMLESTGNLLPPFVILGACNPKLSYRAIQSDHRVGLLLPCNIVIEQITEKKCNVIFANPIPLMDIDPFRKNEIVIEVARLAYEGLMRAFAALSMD